MKQFLESKYIPNYFLYAIFFIAITFRLYGVNWDQNQHLHPDERFLTMVTERLQWPRSLGQYFSPSASPLNPYNVGFNFFVYGTLPQNIVKFFSGFIVFDKYPYNNIALVGRLISAVFDLGIVFLVLKIGEKVFNKKVGLLASFIYASSVLPIQLSHFFAVDTFLVFFITFAFYFFILYLNSKNKIFAALSGVFLGFAIASKISAVLFLPVAVLGFLLSIIKEVKFDKPSRYQDVLQILPDLFLFLLFCYISLRVGDPRAFSNSNFLNPSLNPLFVQNLKQLESFSNPNALFPPAVQWIKTKPIIFPLKNIVLWGLGLPLGILTLAGVIYSSCSIGLVLVKNIKKALFNLNNLTTRNSCYLLILFWILLVFFYEGIQVAKTMRYFYPIYPFLALLTANFIYQVGTVLNKKYKLQTTFFYCSVVLLLLIWPVSFLSIYSRPHSRVTASEWVYKNIQSGSTISCELWDDCLPLSLGGKNSQTFYRTETLALFDPDSKEKWIKIDRQLEGVDYLILSSNRLWGSIPRVPEKYPITSKFYENLFTRKLQFIKVAEFTSYPTIPFLNIPIPDDLSEEAFTVYDHPKVYIFKKVPGSNLYKQ